MKYAGKYILSLLYYEYHSGFNEKLNLGLLMIFPDTNEVFFKYENSFKRISCCYPKTKGKNSLLRAVIKSLNKEIIKINSKGNLGISDYSDPANWINNNILIIDDSSPKFSHPSMGVMYNESANKVFSDMYNIYFGHLNDK